MYGVCVVCHIYYNYLSTLVHVLVQDLAKCLSDPDLLVAVGTWHRRHTREDVSTIQRSRLVLGSISRMPFYARGER